MKKTRKSVRDLARVQVQGRLRGLEYVRLLYYASRLDTLTSLAHLKLEEKGIRDTFFQSYPKNREKNAKTVRNLARMCVQERLRGPEYVRFIYFTFKTDMTEFL